MIHISIVGLFLLLGFLIKYKQWSFLISGYNTSSKREKAKIDVKALCNAVGNFAFVVAGIMLIASIGEFLNILWLIIGCWIFFTIVTVFFLIYANTNNRFKKKDCEG